MFSYKFIVRRDKNDDLRLRITNNRQSSQFSLGLKVTQSELSAALSGDSDNIRLEKLIASWTAQIKDFMLELSDTKKSDMDAKNIKAILQERLIGLSIEPTEQSVAVQGNFKPYFAAFVEKLRNKRTKEIYQATLSRMIAYDPDLDKRRFEDITVRWLIDFDTFLAKTSPSQNARNIHFRNIRTVFNRAIDEELTASYPFRRFKIKPTPTRKRSMSCEQMRKIFNADGLEQWEVKYLDFFKLSFMLIGISVVDLCGLSEITEGRIDYIRAKTHRPYSVKVEPEAMEIIKKHRGEKRLLDFAENYANYRHFYNNLCKGLNSIKGKIGIKELTSYWARHTWATIAAELDIPDAVIGQALGHAETSVTSIYIRRNEQKVDEANRKVLDYVLYGKR